jgi:ATP-dependent DNA helicase DinG
VTLHAETDASDPTPAVPQAADLPVALVAQPGGGAAMADGQGAWALPSAEARTLFQRSAVVIAHAALTARRLSLPVPSRKPDLLDALELYAFVRPASFCAPSAVGLARALGLKEPKGPVEQAQTLREAALALLEELAVKPMPSREEALTIAQTLSKAGWAWGPWVEAALNRTPPEMRRHRGSGLDVWARIAEWEDEAPAGEPGSKPVTPEAARARLSELLARAGLDEARPAQATFAAETAFAFSPRAEAGQPRMMLAEAGTGVGKTLGYLAPASLWAEANGPAVWISTYTRALQRQIERESAALYPDPAVRARKAVVRKGRENYLCLLNYQELTQGALMGGGDVVGAGLVARWARVTRDGDMTGGDFPAWLPNLFAVAPVGKAGPANLVDRRGECIHAGCAHYRLCFVEKAIRASRHADLVIANHALVMSQAAFDSVRAARSKRRPQDAKAEGGRKDSETVNLKRVVFDEGHHLFDAADSAFSACLSGQETAELRRWIRGPESRRRGRGLEMRLADLVAEREDARLALIEVIRAAAQLPGEGWSSRIAPLPEYDGEAGEAQPQGPVEGFLAAMLVQLRARAEGSDQGLECPSRPGGSARRRSRRVGDGGPRAAGRRPAGSGASRACAASGLAGHAAAGRGRGGRRRLRRLVRSGVRRRPHRRRRLPPPLGRSHHAPGSRRAAPGPRPFGHQRHLVRSGPRGALRPGRNAYRRRAAGRGAQAAAPDLAVRLCRERSRLCGYRRRPQ